MNDDQTWEFEQRLWTGPASAYEEQVSERVLMALPADPYLYDHRQAIAAVKDTPRWDSADFVERHLERPADDLIVLSYRVEAKRAESDYHALRTSTLLDVDGTWQVVQNQQTPLGMEVADPANAK